MEHRCPDPDCKEKILMCLNKKVSKTVLIGIMLGVLSSGVGLTIYAMESNKQQKACVQKNTERIIAIESKLQNMKENQVEIKATTKRTEETLNQMKQDQITKQQMTDLIKAINR